MSLRRPPSGRDPDLATELMYFAYRGFVGEADRILAARGLNRAHHRVLFFVARLRSPTVGELIRTLAVSKQALALPLRELKAQDLVAWTVDPDDARVKRLALTPEGGRLLARLSATQRRSFARAFATAGAAATAAWFETMRELAAGELERSGRALPVRTTRAARAPARKRRSPP